MRVTTKRCIPKLARRITIAAEWKVICSNVCYYQVACRRYQKFNSRSACNRTAATHTALRSAPCHIMHNTRLPFNLRPTTRECVHLITRGHFRSRDKDCGHTVRSAIFEPPSPCCMQTLAVCFIEPELLPIEILHCGNRDFRSFCSRDLDLNRMTFVYDLDLYPLRIGFWNFSYYRHTYTHTHATEVTYHCGGQNICLHHRSLRN